MDPRIERTREAVQRATLEVLAERGYGELTIDAVARRARVGRSTIYRHWTTKLELISDALESLNQQPGPEPFGDGGSIERVTQLIEHLADVFRRSIVSDCLPSLIDAAEHHPEVASFLHTYSATRRRALVDAIRASVESGDLPVDVDPQLAALALSGAIVYCRTMTPDRLGQDDARRLVALVLGGDRSAAAAAPSTR